MKNQRALTLIELLITLAVVTILVSAGVPRLQGYSESNRLVAKVNRISGDISLARSEAIKRGLNVTLCGSGTSMIATPVCDTTQWELGWIYFIDANNDSTFNTADNDVLLGIGEALPGGLTLRSSDFDNLAVLRFQPNGAVRDEDADGDSDGTFTVCGPGADVIKARAVNVSNLGRTSIARDLDDPADATVNDINNVNVTCP